MTVMRTFMVAVPAMGMMHVGCKGGIIMKRGMKMKILLGLAFATLLCLGPATASAAPIAFSGFWAPGFETGVIDPAPLTFTANATLSNSWGVPGVGLGTSLWPDGDGYRDFHIEFKLPTGVHIDFTLGTDCTGGVSGGTVFCGGSPTVLISDTPWTAVPTGLDSIDFFAPAG